MRFVWTVRDAADAKWGVEQLRQQLGTLPDVELHVSPAETEREVGVGWALDAGVRGQEDVRAIELQQREQFRDRVAGVDAELVGVAKEGRPNLRNVVDEVFECDANDRVAVLVCGPDGMGRSVRRQVSRWVGRGREVFWHSEEFGW